MHEAIDSILKSNSTTELQIQTLLRGPADLEQAFVDYSNARLAPDEIELFQFKLIYLENQARYHASHTLRSSLKRNYIATAEFYKKFADRLEVNVYKRQLITGFQIRSVILHTISSHIEKLVVDALEEKIHYFDNILKKENDPLRRNKIENKKQLFENALGKNYETNDPENFRHLERLIEVERTKFDINVINNCLPYCSLRNRTDIKVIINNEPFIVLLNNIYRNKIVAPLKYYHNQNSCFGIIGIHILDIIREFSLHSPSTYGTLFAVHNNLRYTMSCLEDILKHAIRKP